jgi:D-alanine-D-alanine ligase
MQKKLELLIIFGGMSSEHEVSCLSAASILHHINRDNYRVHTLGITKKGRWILTDATPERIADGSWENKIGNRGGILSPDRSFTGIRTLLGDEIPIDCVFPVLHGKYGEDGTIQGLFDLMGIPYVGPGVLASSTCMDKAVTKSIVEKIVESLGIRQANHATTDRFRFASGPTETVRMVTETFRNQFPLFVKPANAGSSVGITKVWDAIQLFDGIRKAAEEDHKIIVEEAIVGRELEVAVLGNRKPQASKVGEIIASNEFYDYEAKYINELSRTEIVTDLPDNKLAEIQRAAVAIYETMGCRGLSRVDFFLEEDGTVVFNEINTMPGFTKISMYPKLWEASGIEYSDLIDRLIELAMEETEWQK